MKFMCAFEIDAALFAYLGFELLSVSYDVWDGRKQFFFDIPETAETCAGTVTNDPTKMLNDWQAGEFTISDERELFIKYQAMVNRIVAARQKAIDARKAQNQQNSEERKERLAKKVQS